MIALTGQEEADLREFWEHLDVKPPLVGLVREAIQEFLVYRRTHAVYGMKRHAEWAAKFGRKHPPFRIVQ